MVLKMTERTLYLELIKRALSNYLYLGQNTEYERYYALSRSHYANYEWKIPEQSRPHTLLNKSQLDSLESLIRDVLANDVPGDFVEAGVYRGGCCIFMRAALKAFGDSDRRVWVADTFSGIPYSSSKSKSDRVDSWEDRWVCGLDEVKSIFSRYQLLDEQVCFLEGTFSETFPKARFGQFALVRLDADSYESTQDALEHLYPKLSVGGYLVIDDWHLAGCLKAVHDYRQKHGIKERIIGLRGGQSVLPCEAHWKVERH